MTDVLLNGRRVDGRRPREHRMLEFRLGTQPQADGSALLTHGNSRLLATVHGPSQARASDLPPDEECVLRVLYSKPPFASMTERRRRGRGDRKQDETALLIEEAIGGVVLKQVYRRSQIEVRVQVLQSDGSELAAAINAVSLALMDAGVAMRGHLVAATVGYCDQEPLVDLNSFEQSAGLPCLTVACVGQRVLHASVESRLHAQQLEPLLACAGRACTCVADYLAKDVKIHLLAACCFQSSA